MRRDWRNHFPDRGQNRESDWGWCVGHNGERIFSSRSWAAEPFDRTVRAVCAGCNNGWMNNLENDAGDLILSLAKGETRSFAYPELEVLMQWMAKTTFVIEKWDKGVPVAAKDQLLAVQARKVPPRFMMWMYPIRPNGAVKFRTTPCGVVDMGVYHSVPSESWRITSLLFMQVHFLAVYASTKMVDDVLRAMNLARVCGNSVATRTGGWRWPPNDAAPWFLADAMHAAVARYIMFRAADVGMAVHGQIDTF